MGAISELARYATSRDGELCMLELRIHLYLVTARLCRSFSSKCSLAFMQTSRLLDLQIRSLSSTSLQILIPDLPGHNVKSRFRTEPPRPRCAHAFIRKHCTLVVDLDRLASPPTGSRIRHQLHTAVLLQTAKPENGCLDCLPHRESSGCAPHTGRLVSPCGSPGGSCMPPY
jgi:hypothetical protein